MKTALVVMLLLGACDSEAKPTTAPPEAPGGDEEEPAAAPETQPVTEPVEVGDASEQDTAAFARSTRELAVDLWQRLRSREGNLAVSPASISMAMSMTWAGARGETAEQIASALHFGDDPESIHRAAHAQLAQWNDPDRETYELRVVNRLFAQDGITLEPPFVALTRDVYGAPIEAVDFRGSPDGARRHINEWVAQRTSQRIENLLPAGALDELTRLVLTNAVYFHGSWKHRFPEERTRPMPFHLRGGAEASVSTMRLTERLGYARTSSVQLLELPYVGDELSMVVVLPRDRDGSSALEAELDLERLDGWLGALRARRVEVLLPRFRVDPPESVPLEETLGQMGMPLAFSPRADFTGMRRPLDPDEQLFIDDVYHQAFVEVNEEGTEAAAATGVVMRARGAGAAEPQVPIFRADHPFLFLLRDIRSGAILFLGRVVDPR